MIGQLLLGLSILVGLHELGHLLAAKLFGMRVEKYSIGFPPKLFGVKYGETEYSLGAIPLGGFVKISGMVDESLDLEKLKEEPKHWEFRSKPAWQRLIVMMGGIVVNVITGIIIYTGLVYAYGESYLPAREARYGIVAHDLAKQIGLQTGDRILEINGRPFERFSDVASPDLLLSSNGYYTIEREGEIRKISVPNNFIETLSASRGENQFISPIAPFKVGKVQSASAAAKAGLAPGDQIVGLNGQPIRFFHELQDSLMANKGKSVQLRVERGSDKLDLSSNVSDEGKLGFQPELLLKEEKLQYSLIESVPRGTALAFNVVWLNIKSFGKIFRREVNFSNSVSGPIAMAQDLYGGIWDWHNFWRVTGFLSMILAFMNFLPIPPLDGGHVLFLTYEMIARRKPSDKFLENAQKVGMVLVLSLMVYVIFNDFIKRVL